MRLSKNLAIVSKECVACGSCVNVCPLGAISIFKGLYAQVDAYKCIGCGKCEKVCPASVITIVEWEGQNEKKETLV